MYIYIDFKSINRYVYKYVDIKENAHSLIPNIKT